jgi:ATP-dependent DNA helicase RecQ
LTQALEVLHRVFGYQGFCGAQADIIEHPASGGDAILSVVGSSHAG